MAMSLSLSGRLTLTGRGYLSGYYEERFEIPSFSASEKESWMWKSDQDKFWELYKWASVEGGKSVNSDVNKAALKIRRVDRGYFEDLDQATDDEIRALIARGEGIYTTYREVVNILNKRCDQLITYAREIA